jgi:hypothetical protein
LRLPCWVHLDEAVREEVGPDNLGGVGLAHVRQGKLVGDGSAEAGYSPVQAVDHAVTFAEAGCSPALAVDHAETSAEASDQDHVK